MLLGVGYEQVEQNEQVLVKVRVFIFILLLTQKTPLSRTTLRELHSVPIIEEVDPVCFRFAFALLIY